jgi:hypothetical protein
MKRLSMVFGAALLAVCAHASAASLFFDFGNATQQTAGNYNNITHTQAPILNAIDSTGAGTGIGLSTIGFNELGPNDNGTTTPGAPGNVFDPQATRDNLFGHSDNFNIGSPRPMAVLDLSGLDGSGATSYTFTFFASRTGVSDNRETQYSIAGLNNGVGLLNAAANTSNVAVVSGIVPTAGGTIEISVMKGPANNNGSGFFYLGAMKIDSVPVPEPTTMALLGGAAILVAVRRRFAS